MYTLTRAEQETVIAWDAHAHTATIETAIPAVIRKLDKLVEQFPDEYKCVKVDVLYHAKRYEVDSRYIRFGRPLSESAKDARRQNLILRQETVQG